MKNINYKDLIQDFKELVSISPYISLLTILKVVLVPSKYIIRTKI